MVVRRSPGDFVVKLAAVQETPVFYDLEASLEKGVAIIARVAREGANLIVFPEGWLPNYPCHVWAIQPDNWPSPVDEADGILWRNAVDLSRDGLAPIRAAARDHGVVVVMGINERAPEMSAGTLYNTGVIIDADGTILNAHRKLMPTGAERTVWGFGDGSTLRVVETAVGRVGVLLCWENFMPLARMALYAQNLEILCAPTADPMPEWNATMQHIGREGGCFVVGCGAIQRVSAIPKDFPERDRFDEGGEWNQPGGAVVVAPGGQILAGPMRETIGSLGAEIDRFALRSARRAFDVAGHYARPDVFTLTVDTSARAPVRFTSGG
ncbi:nitrilase [Mameliella alba]|nr:carbon-nitrogen hydrolase family protein [Mameliella sp. LZ-28]OWV58988.1 nitrilase [Mameliella alba]